MNLKQIDNKRRIIMLELYGALTYEKAPILWEQLETLIEQGWTHIIVDVSKISFISSHNVMTLIAQQQNLMKHYREGSLRVVMRTKNTNTPRIKIAFELAKSPQAIFVEDII